MKKWQRSRVAGAARRHAQCTFRAICKAHGSAQGIRKGEQGKHHLEKHVVWRANAVCLTRQMHKHGVMHLPQRGFHSLAGSGPSASAMRKAHARCDNQKCQFNGCVGECPACASISVKFSYEMASLNSNDEWEGDEWEGCRLYENIVEMNSGTACSCGYHLHRH